MSDRRRVAIALGSNLGDRAAALAFAAERLSAALSNFTISSAVETTPEGEGLEDQPLYLNAAAVGETTLDARELLDLLLDIEAQYQAGSGRFPERPRTLDLDLVLLGAETIDEPGLQVPHPRFRDRFFVLGPLAEVGPDMRDPVSGLTVAQLLQRLLRDSAR